MDILIQLIWNLEYGLKVKKNTNTNLILIQENTDIYIVF